MAYRVYTTEAIVVGGAARATSDRTVTLFTKELGMVYARVQNMRASESKLRYTLQDFSEVRVSLVRGKADWRVVGTESRGNFYWNTGSRDGRRVLRNIVQLLRRLVHGEEVHGDLFDLVEDSLRYAMRADAISKEEEAVMSLRILHALGYIAPSAALSPYLEALTLTEALTEVKNSGVLVTPSVEAALAISHL